MSKFVLKFLAIVTLMTVSIHVPAGAVTWNDYWNTVRNGGTVIDVFSTTVGGQPWVAFTLALPDGERSRWDCGTRAVATDLNCVAIAVGDFLLVNGHVEDRLSCHHDGIDNFAVPNGIYRYENAAWVLLTP